MYYYKVTDQTGKEHARSLKSCTEALALAEKLVNEVKCDVTVWSTEPIRKTANYYEYGYHAHITVCYKAPVEVEELYTLHYEYNGKVVDTKPAKKSDLDIVIEYFLKKENIPYELKKAN